MRNYLLGDYVKMHRVSKGMSLREFGKMCDISHTTIDCIEKGYDPRTGKEINLTNATLIKLASGMGEPLSKLVELSEGLDEKETIHKLSPEKIAFVNRVQSIDDQYVHMLNNILDTIIAQREG